MKISDEKYVAYIRERCRESFPFYARYMFKQQKGQRFLFSFHHQLICDDLERVHRGEKQFLIINMPPRYGKTELCIKLFVSWCYGLNPSCEFIHLSYSDDLVLDNSSAIKEIIQSDAFQQIFPDVELTKTSDGAWKTSKGGCFLARPSGGQVTGYGAGKTTDFLDGNGFGGAILIDDPLKPDDANSDVKRENINARWDSTIKSRFNSTRTPCIVIMQRLHENDFCGMLLNDSEYKFDVLRLPAILDEGQPTERALWEGKHTLEQLKAMQSKNSYAFSSQYQQSPRPLGGGIIQTKWFNYYDVLPRIKYSAMYVDTALKESESNDYQVASVWGLGVDGNLYLIDLMRGRFQAYELETRIPAVWHKHKANPALHLRSMGVEDKASGTQLIQTITKRVTPRIPVKAIKRSRSKLERVMDIQGFIESGYVYLPRSAPFLSNFLLECEQFTPNDSHPHDDQIDTMCDAITEMLAKSSPAYADIM